jgi:hypothetical protein
MRRRDVQRLRSGRLPKRLVLRRVGQRRTCLRMAAAVYEKAQLRMPSRRARRELQVQRTDGGIAFELSVRVQVFVVSEGSGGRSGWRDIQLFLACRRQQPLASIAFGRNGRPPGSASSRGSFPYWLIVI